MNLSLLDTSLPVRAIPRRLRLAAAAGLTALGSLTLSGAAFAQAASPAGGLGEQLNKMTGEAIDAGGTGANAVMYLAAIALFIFGVWAIWKSRQPQNREGGYVAMGVAGLVLCGLFATGPSWIGKSAVTASGAQATVNNTPKVVQFQ